MKKLNTKMILTPGSLWFSFGTLALAAGNFSPDQSLIYTGPLTPVTPVSVREQEQAGLTNSPDVFIPATEVQRSDVPNLLRDGPLTFRPHFDLQYLYGTGIESSPSISGKTSIYTISPGMLLEYGQHWALDYTPTITLYSNDKFKNTLGHSLTLNGATAYEDWQFGLTQTYLNSEQVIAETGGQTFQESFGTTLSASRILNDKMSADFSLVQRIQDTDGYESSRDWSLSSFLNYQFWQRLTVSGGAILGYVNVDTGADQTYQDLQARVNWRITDKIGLSANAGGEAREFTGSSTLLSPVYGATIQYELRKRTQISIGVSSSVAPSLFQGLVTDTTSYNINLYQQLFKKFLLALGANYGQSDYTASNGNANRTDKTYGYNARLSHPIFKRGEIALIYQLVDNQSSQSGFSFHTDQVGAEFNYKF